MLNFNPKTTVIQHSSPDPNMARETWADYRRAVGEGQKTEAVFA